MGAMRISIFCGGSGKRFWPLSRRDQPKQLLQIFDGKSTLQLTFERILPLIPPRDIFVSTNFSYFDEIQRQLPRLPVENLIGEPALRDLGPAVALNAAILAQVSGPDEPFGIIWSDHVVKNEELFRAMIKHAEQLVTSGPSGIVFCGCFPRFANENLGWLDLDGPVFGEGVVERGLKSFKYRPTREQAESFVAAGNYAWNLGYFVSTPRFILEAFHQYHPKIYEAVVKIAEHWGRPDYLRILDEIYPKLEKISFDDAILERLDFKQARGLVADLGWADVGNPYAYKEILAGAGNLLVGDVLDLDSEDCLVYSDSEQFIATIGLKGVAVIVMRDAVLVCSKDKTPKIKEIVDELERKGRTSHL